MPKGVRIDDEQRDSALGLYLQGQTFAEVEAATGISRAAMSGILEERARQDPDILDVHELSRWLKEKKVATEALMHWAAVGEKVEEAGLSWDQVTTEVAPYLHRFGSKAVEYAVYGQRYHELTAPRGWSYLELAENHTRLLSENDMLTGQIEESKVIEATMSQKIDETSARLGHIEELENLDVTLRRMRRSPAECGRLLAKSEKILVSGVTTSDLEAIGEEFAGQGMNRDTAPAEIARLVKRYGSLKQAGIVETRKVRFLQRQSETLSEGVDELKEEKLGLQTSCRSIRRVENGLKVDYNKMADRHRAREASLEEELGSRREKTTSWCEAEEKETKTKCAAILSEAKAKATAIVDVATQKARRIEGAATLKAEQAERKAGDLEVIIKASRMEYQRNTDDIAGARVLWNYFERNSPATLERLRVLHQPGGAFEGQALPDTVRQVLISHAEAILTTDAKLRANMEEAGVQRSQRTARQIIKEALEGKARIERRVGLLLRLLQTLQNTEATMEAVMKAALSDVGFMADAIRRAPIEYLIEVFVKTSIPDRIRCRNALNEADERLDMDLDRQINGMMKAMMERTIREAFSPVPMFPTPMFPRARTVREVQAPPQLMTHEVETE